MDVSDWKGLTNLYDCCEVFGEVRYGRKHDAPVTCLSVYTTSYYAATGR